MTNVILGPSGNQAQSPSKVIQFNYCTVHKQIWQLGLISLRSASYIGIAAIGSLMR